MTFDSFPTQLVVGVSNQGEEYTDMKDAAFVMDEFNFWTAALTEKQIKDAIGKFISFSFQSHLQNNFHCHFSLIFTS